MRPVRPVGTGYGEVFGSCFEPQTPSIGVSTLSWMGSRIQFYCGRHRESGVIQSYLPEFDQFAREQVAFMADLTAHI